jgi:hypothetical protein
MLAILALTLAAPAQPAISISTITTSMLVDLCSKSQGMQLDPCASYILGVADTLQIDRVTCRPQSDAATLQTLTIVRRYLNDHPERWDRHPAFLVRDALKGAFPCR